MRQVSAILKVSISSRWDKEILHKQRKSTCPKSSDALRTYVAHLLKDIPYLTCSELAKHVLETFKIRISRQLVCILIKQTNLSYKRIRTRGTSKRKEELVHSFVSRYKNIQKDVKIVSIDESGFDQRAHPIYGYAQKGKKAIVTHSLSTDRNRYTLILAVSNIGEKEYIVTKDSVNGSCFVNFIKSLTFPEGTYIMLDNASIHKTVEFKQAIYEKKYLIIYTPPYGCEYNPIELVFGRVKQAFYKARYADEKFNILKTIERLVPLQSPEFIVKCFKHVEENYIKT
jgi:transposase